MFRRSAWSFVKDGHKWRAACSSSAALSQNASSRCRREKRPRRQNLIVGDLALLANSNVFSAARRFPPIAALGGAAPTFVLHSRHFSTTNERSAETVPESTAPSATAATAGEATPNLIDGKQELVLDWIPEKPSATEELLDLVGEPTFHSLGLASWWPSGRMQYFMEQMHLYLDIPWWGTIMVTTLLLRIFIFPTVVMAQKNAAKMNEIHPQMALIQEKITEARQRGDLYEQNVLGGELQKLMKDKNVSPIKAIYPILMQAPFFVSMFVGLRGMAKLPVPSMETETFLWISDLTMRDGYYLTPLFITATMYLQFHLAADGANLQQLGPIGKGLMKAVPCGLFFFTMKFPAALTLYWATTNVISVTQALLIRTPAIRAKLGIPPFKRHAPTTRRGKAWNPTIQETCAHY